MRPAELYDNCGSVQNITSSKEAPSLLSVSTSARHSECVDTTASRNRLKTWDRTSGVPQLIGTRRFRIAHLMQIRRFKGASLILPAARIIAGQMISEAHIRLLGSLLGGPRGCMAELTASADRMLTFWSQPNISCSRFSSTEQQALQKASRQILLNSDMASPG